MIMDENFSGVDKGKLIQAALMKTVRNKYKKPHETNHRLNRDYVINLFQPFSTQTGKVSMGGFKNVARGQLIVVQGGRY